ncbi:hypothetical protein [Brevundimonas goettingensis]|uniref:Uncharacterized protein n=1 Tax=Brevundimonas goettingensis TaxID=2774190 RepID=A0A975GZ50_9CAUL|nr:hypothetical protein [Brevundimonas goettingensis]QTC92290.1 hypothetical protein IFJ75_05190 [Brevundimonas goettingensis]
MTDAAATPTLTQRLRRWRMDGIDIVFGEADQRPVQVLVAAFVVIWLIVAVWLTGFPSPWGGERGAMVIPAGAESDEGLGAAAGNSAFQWAEFLRGDGEAPEGLPPFPAGPGQERDWLDRHVCGPFSKAQSNPVSRAAVAYRISESNGLCQGFDKTLDQARLARTFGAGAGAILGGLILALLAVGMGVGVYAFARVRDAYRRLYVSHHRPDPESR